MAFYIDGKDFLLLAKKNNVYVPFSCGQEVSVVKNIETLPTDTINTGQAETFITGSYGIRITFGGLMTLRDIIIDKWHTLELFEDDIRLNGLDYKLLFTDQDGYYQDMTGYAVVPSISINKRTGQLVKWGFELLGSGQGIIGGGNGSTPTAKKLNTPLLYATPVSPTQVNISVGSVPNASAIPLEWSADGSTGWAQLSNVAGVYQHTGRTAGVPTYYRAWADGDVTNFVDSNIVTTNATTTAQTVVVPTIISAVVQNASANVITLTYNIALASANAGSGHGLTVSGGYGVNFASASGSTVTLTLDDFIEEGESITVSLGNATSNFVKDANDASNLAADLINYPVTNYVFAPVAQELNAPSLYVNVINASRIDIVMESVTNAISYELEVSFNTGVWELLSTTPGFYSHTSLIAGDYVFRARAIGNGTTYLTSDYTIVGIDTETGSTINKQDITTVGGETSLVFSETIGVSASNVLFYFRDGIQKQIITSGIPTDKQVKFTSLTGTFEFSYAADAGEFHSVMYKS